jgi:hypothetical protein
MKLVELNKKVNEVASPLNDEVFTFIEELQAKKMSIKEIRKKVEKKFKHLSKDEIDLIIQVL